MADKKQIPSDSGEKEPKTAPEVTDADLLTAVQKEKLEEAFGPLPEPAAAIALEPDESPPSLPTVADSPDEPETEDTPPPQPEDEPHGHRIRRFFAGYWHRGWWTIPLTLLVIAGGLAAVPYTRFKLAAYVISQKVTVTVIDNSTKKPVSSAEVSLDGRTAKTDQDGKAVISDVKPGGRQLKVTKKYYQDATSNVSVPLNKSVDKEVAITATGRQVPVAVVNKITGKPLADVTLMAVGTEVKTDKDGKATIVLPADKPDLPINLTNGGYNTLDARVQVTDQEVKENTFAMVPSGKVYFLSRQSGKIDVVKTDLDGGNRQTVVYGTGKEEDRSTVLLASRDWKYLALHSKRDSGPAKLYLIDTSTDKMSELDSANAKFTLVGWNNHDFVYAVERTNMEEWDANYMAVKSFNADKKQSLTLDQTAAEKTKAQAILYQHFANFYLLDGKVFYSVQWSAFNGSGFDVFGDKNVSLRTAATDASGKKDVKTFPAKQYTSVVAKPYLPDEVQVAVFAYADGEYSFFEYENGEVKSANLDEDKFFSDDYPTYLVSPSGEQTFWNDERDGRATFFIGDKAGDNGKKIGAFDDFQVYGWYGNDYLLASKKGSELYILPAAGGTPLKVADYHKPQLSYRGYGGGYGGL